MHINFKYMNSIYRFFKIQKPRFIAKKYVIEECSKDVPGAKYAFTHCDRYNALTGSILDRIKHPFNMTV